jgi:phospholipid/cholesterol/gamma-HCH transport system substrate-binding protein
VITQRTKHQLIAFAILAVLALGYSAIAIAGVSVVHRPYDVSLQLPATGGLYQGSDVSYRGVHVGKVSSVRLTRDGVEATLHLQARPKVPADTTAVVTFLSGIGQQYVDLRPADSDGPFLAGGSVITADKVQLPPTAAAVLADVDQLLMSIDPQQLDRLMTSVEAAFHGLGPTLQQALDSTTDLVTALHETAPQTMKLLESGRTVLSTQVEAGGDLASFSRSLHQLAATLKSSDGDVRGVVDNGSLALGELTTLLDDRTRRDLSLLLGNLVTVNQALGSRVPAVSQLLVSLPLGLQALGRAAPGDALRLTVTEDVTPVCVYDTAQRTPHQITRRPTATGMVCTDDVANEQQRGAQYVPRGTTAATTSATASAGPGWLQRLLD